MGIGGRGLQWMSAIMVQMACSGLAMSLLLLLLGGV